MTHTIDQHSMPSGRTIIIGDVHGCRAELEDLLALCRADASDRIVLVGDLVAKGPDSRGVVTLAREGHFQAVLGNHDAKVLSLRDDVITPGHRSSRTAALPPGRHETVAAELQAADWAYLETLPLFLRLPELETVVVHAGLIPGVPIEDQPRKFLLNLRSITPGGEPSKRVEDGAPWATFWPGPEQVVFGHDAVRGLQRHRFATGLDTGCVYGRALTALLLPERRLLSVPARAAYVPL